MRSIRVLAFRSTLVATAFSALFGVDPASAMPDLVVESVDVSGLARDCREAHASGMVVAAIRNDGNTAVEAPIRVAFFEDRDLDGTYDPAADALLAEVPMAPLGALGWVAVPADIGAELTFAGAPIHAFVDSRDGVREVSERNNVRSSASPPAVSPCVVSPPTFAVT